VLFRSPEPNERDAVALRNRLADRPDEGVDDAYDLSPVPSRAFRDLSDQAALVQRALLPASRAATYGARARAVKRDSRLDVDPRMSIDSKHLQDAERDPVRAAEHELASHRQVLRDGDDRVSAGGVEEAQGGTVEDGVAFRERAEVDGVDQLSRRGEIEFPLEDQCLRVPAWNDPKPHRPSQDARREPAGSMVEIDYRDDP